MSLQETTSRLETCTHRLNDAQRELDTLGGLPKEIERLKCEAKAFRAEANDGLAGREVRPPGSETTYSARVNGVDQHSQVWVLH